MNYSEKQIDALREEVCKRLSNKRFLHTLGVEQMAVRIAEKCLPDSIDKIRVSALLHDISKEYSEAEYFLLLKTHNIALTDEDVESPALWHSMTAPIVIGRDFPELADADVLSAVYNHTVGSPDMSVFDEIILLADYIEEGRSYPRCVHLREEFLAQLEMAECPEKSIVALHRAVVKSLDNNIIELSSRGNGYHSRTMLTRDAILAKLER